MKAFKAEFTMVDLVERLRLFMQHKAVDISQLAKNLKYKHPQKLYRLFNTETARPSVHIITDIKLAYPDLNLDWLFKGFGNMIVNESDNVDFKKKYYRCLEEKDELWSKILKLWISNSNVK